MHRAIIGLFDGEPDSDEPDLEGSTHFGVDAHGYAYLDGAATIYHGEAATDVDEEVTNVSFTSHEITRSVKIVERTVATTFFADPDAGFVTVDSADGTFLWDRLQLRHSCDIERAALALDDWRDDLQAMDQARCWQLGWDEPDDRDDVGVTFHDAASFDRADGITQLGFEYLWNGNAVRGTAAASGYVCVFDGVSRPADVGRWLREEVLPHAYVPEDDDGEQTTLGGSGGGA